METTTTTSTLAGPTETASPRHGFDSLERETRIESLPVEGSLPPWLQGSLIRTGPAKWEVGERTMNHWFDGLAMLHRFSFAGAEVSYANRFLETRAYRAAREKGEISYSEFATDPCRSLFQRVASVFSPKLTDNANVNLVKLGERFVAMTETPIPVQFDAATLDAAGAPYDVPGELTTAHPHMDRATGSMLNYSAKLVPPTRYRFYRVGPAASKAEVVAQVPVREPAYMHSFGLTERWLVLAEFPFVVTPLDIPLKGRPYIENYRWEPQRGTRIRLVDRRSGEAIGPFETEPRFAFHHVNSYDDGDEVVVDVCTFPDAGIVQDLYLERLRAGKPVAQPSLERFRVSPTSRRATLEKLGDASFELPRINYPRCNERSYRYVWGAGSAGGWIDRIVKVDVERRQSSEWSEDGRYPGEPVFVAAPEARDEDEGVLLTIVFDAERGNSFLLVLGAQNLEELARAEVPHHIPFGFHGQFARA